MSEYTSTDDLDLKETLDDLNCNNSYNVYIVWISADRIECCLGEARNSCKIRLSRYDSCIILSPSLIVIYQYFIILAIIIVASSPGPSLRGRRARYTPTAHVQDYQ